MTRYKRMDKHKMAMLNKQNVMRCIANYAPINRAAIAKMVGLSIPSVMEITDVLLAHGMISSEMKRVASQGKRPELLSVCGDHYRFIGIDVGRTTVRIVLAGLDNKVIDMVKYPTSGVGDVRAFVNTMAKKVTALVKHSGIDISTIVGICVAMPGLIEYGTGRVIFSPNFGWADVPLQAWMNELLPYEVIVENANRVQASWELCRDHENEKRTIICIGLGYGIGAGFLQQGKLYYGASGTSGEIGHVPVDPDSDVSCSCGNTGCLEAMASGAAIANQVRRLVERKQAPMLEAMCQGDLNKIEAKMAFDAAKSGDKVAQMILDNTARYVGIALATTINILDPDRIYLCGGMMKNGPEFLETIKQQTFKRKMQKTGRDTVILQGDPDEWNVARGAAQVVPYYNWESERLDFMR